LSQGGTDSRHLQICQSFLSDTQKDGTVNKTKQKKSKPKKKKEKKEQKTILQNNNNSSNNNNKNTQIERCNNNYDSNTKLLIASKSHLIMIAALLIQNAKHSTTPSIPTYIHTYSLDPLLSQILKP
jgi:hypothetical protein